MDRTLEEKEAYLKARRVHLDRLKTKIGLNRAKFLMVGGAPVHPQLVEFFLSIDIQLFQVSPLVKI
jgi:long-subunit acyl-CoA synthetase (AMP-forming)